MDRPLITNRQDVAGVLNAIAFLTGPPDPLKVMDDLIKRVREDLHFHRLASLPWQAWFHEFARAVMKEGTDVQCPTTYEYFADLLLDKHRRYGAAPIRQWGPLGLVIRLSSKLERYKNQRTVGVDPEDTLTDMLGYCVLGYRLVTETP